MTIRVIFHRKNHIAKTEKTKKTEHLLWEERDGYHAFPADGVYTDVDGLLNPIIIYYCDLVSPVGISDAYKTINEQITILSLIKHGGGKISSALGLGRILALLERYLGVIIVIGMLALAGLYAVGAIK